MKVVDGVRHDVLGVHCLLQAATNGLHGDGAAPRVGDAALCVHPMWKRVAQCHRREEHLYADEKVLVAGGHCARRRVLHRCDDIGLLQYSERDTLPERQEDDGLDCAELEYGLVRSEQVPRSEVEQEQSVQSQRDGDVVDDGDVDVSTIRTIYIHTYIYYMYTCISYILYYLQSPSR